MEVVSAATARLFELAEKLKLHRNNSDGVSNDVYEAAADWHIFGKALIACHPEGNLTSRMNQEIEQYELIEKYWPREVAANPDYTEVMKLGAVLFAECKKRKYHPDGYLGHLRIMRETFAFLTSDYGLQPSEDLYKYISPNVNVTLDSPSDDSACYVYKSDPSNYYWLEDILFMVGQPEDLVTPPSGRFTTEAELQAWYTQIAMLLREYGGDVLANKPGVWERLAAARAERERLYNEACERQWLLDHPGEPLPD